MRAPNRPSTPPTDRTGLFVARGWASALAALILAAACAGASVPTARPSPIQTASPSSTQAQTATPAPKSSPSPNPTASPSPIPTPSPSPTAKADFPVTLTDDEGTSVTIDAEPQKIVSLSPSNTEILYAVGGGNRLVGGTDADDYPAEAAAAPDVVVQQQILKEQIAALDPDLVLANGALFNPAADIAQLRNLGFPVLVLTAQDINGVQADVQLIGDAIGNADEAKQVVDEMTSEFRQINRDLAYVKDRPRTLYEVGYQPDIYAPPANSAYADLIRQAKGEPVSGNDAYVISLEQLVAADPEVILLGDAAYGTCPADVAKRPGWKGITAVKDGAVRPANDLVITRPGPRMPLGLVSLVRGIHPDITLPDFPPEPALCTGA